jgi:uracil-DNA glycosylase
VGNERQNFETGAAASLLGWWRDAGVDTAIAEAPADWLGSAVVAKSLATPVEVPAIKAPQTLEALVDHLMRFDLAEAGPPRRRLAPAGNPASDLMVLIDFPDAADIDAGQLLSDPIFDKMLEALGRTRETAYVAALCPGRPIVGRLSDDVIETLVPLACQHIAFVAPKHLWLMGNAASRAILGFDDIRAKGKLHSINHPGLITDAIATAHPRMFARQPGSKASAWAEMQRLIVKEDA